MNLKNQFGIVRLLVLITCIGLVLALIVRLRFPIQVSLPVGIFFLAYILWGVVRGPWLWNEYWRILRVRASRRQEMHLDVERRREQQSASPDN